MKRAGFTMIELIFVIVILGILASVALPKLIGVKDQADEGLVKAFVGTLNRTVGPSKWSGSIANDANGSIATAAYDINTTDTDFPASFSLRVVDTTKCALATATKASAAVATTTDGKFVIVCRDGNVSTAPRFWYAAVANVGADFNDTKIKLP
jgi:prepilin-type N-terminal cleavage/methylation domain-containing protein